jgi:hypothetical protein
MKHFDIRQITLLLPTPAGSFAVIEVLEVEA